MARSSLDPDALRAYIARDWQGARTRKREYWRTRLEHGGLGEALRITAQLHGWMKLADPSWPTAEHREEDIETHRRVAEALAKTAPHSRSGVRATSRRRARRVR